MFKGNSYLIGVPSREPHGYEDRVEVVKVEAISGAVESEALGLEGAVGDSVG